jgi:hypothetical protein
MLSLVAVPAYGDSSSAHAFCMERLREVSAPPLHQRFRPLVQSDEEWDRLVSVVLETWHEACFSLLGVPDNREETNQMPWESPGMICGGAR